MLSQHQSQRHEPRGGMRRALGFFLLWLLASPGLAAEEAGVVVVEAPASGAMFRGGVRVGDRVLSCNVGGLGWSVRNLFDLRDCEWELGPRGPVTLRVMREGQKRDLVVMPGKWKATVRPVLDARGDALWESGLAEAEEGEVPSSAWRQLEGELEQKGQSELALWLLIEQVRQLRTLRRFDEAALALERARSLSGFEDSPRLQFATLWAQRKLLEAREVSLEIRLHNAERLRALAGRLRDRKLVECKVNYHLGWYQAEAKRLDEAGDTLAGALETVRALVPTGSLLEGDLEGYLANVAFVGGDLDSAEGKVRKAIETYEKIAPGGANLAWGYGFLGLIESRRGNLVQAIAGYQRQLSIYREHGFEVETVQPLFNLGIAAERLGDFQTADTALEEALEIAEPDSSMAASLLGQRGYLHLSWGRLRSAAEYNAKAHELLKRHGIKDQRLARSFSRLGHVARYRGDVEGAEEYYLQALTMYEGMGNSYRTGATLSNLGNLARQRKDYETALALYYQALEKMKPETTAHATINRLRLLSNLGRTLLLLGQPDDAEVFLEEALELKRKESPETLDVAASLMLLGDLERSRGNSDRAQLHYRAALDLHSKIVPGRPAEAENQIRLGQLLVDREDLAGAEPFLTGAVDSTSLRASGTVLAADGLYQLARLEVKRGNRRKGLDLHRRAVEALDMQWQKLGGSRDARLSFMHAHADYYRACMELLVEEGFLEEAFELLQRTRARGLRDILAQRDLDLPRSKEAREIENRLVDLARERESLLEKLDAEISEEELRNHRTALRGLRSRRERLLAELRAAAPKLARLKYPPARSLEEVGTTLDDGTVMVSYSVGREQTLAFVLRRGERGQIDLDVERLAIGRDFLGEKVMTFRQSIERHLPGELEQLESQGGELYEVLLAPLSAELGEAERILVAPDGPLHALPFAALRRAGHYLVSWKPIHLAPSATVYAELGQLVTKGRRSVAFGDPVFGPAGDGESETLRAAQGTEFRRLPATRREVEAFERVLPPPVETFVGRQATEERVKQLSEERLVHFASHAVVHEDFPLNSALALAQSSESSSGQENGLLYAWEVIEQMHLEASLVTLSACETALGRESEGEGILGLVWAFHYAGAKSVLASLWNVEDRSTSELMAAFYTGLASGLTKDEALRRAQLQQITTPKTVDTIGTRGVGGLAAKGSQSTAHPFYWAAFQLYGSIYE